MGYVGNQSTNAYSSLPAKQDLTGATGTSLTLSHAVAGPESIDLFINNVRQEPTTAYSVSDTTVTLTGSVVASDDIYVVYNGLALQTIVPPDGSVTSAKLDTNIAVAGDLTVDTNTLHVDSTNNRVGIGTVLPDRSLHIAGSEPSVVLENTGQGTDLKTWRLYSNSSSLQIGTVDDAFSAGQNALEITRDNTDQITGIIFKTGNTSEAMRISGGDILIGTTNIGIGNLGWSFRRNNASFVTTDGNPSLVVKRGSNTGTAIEFVGPNSNSVLGNISVSTTAVAFNQTSDYRLKENVTDITGATDRLKQLNPVRFNFIADADTTVDGFLAHEVQSVVPEAITGTKDAVDSEGNPEYQGIDQSKLVPLLVATIQEQQTAIEALTARVTALEAE